MKHPVVFTLVLALLVFFAWGISSPALAQSAGSYSITWSTVDGGGETSTGGVYAVSGTAGQPDAGAMEGGIYTQTGGFWINFDFSVHLPLIMR